MKKNVKTFLTDLTEIRKQHTSFEQVREIVPIEKWLEDPFYVGEVGLYIYDFWKDKIKDIFDKNYNEVIITGGLGTGKSVCGEWILIRTLYELSCYKNVARLLNLMPHSPIKIYYFTLSMRLAKSTGFAQIRNNIDNIPYFKTEFVRDPLINSELRFPEFLSIECGSDSTQATGTNLLSSILDEANFYENDPQNVTKVLKSPDEFSKVSSMYESIVARGKCVAGHTRVHTEQGFLPIKALFTPPKKFTTKTQETVPPDLTIPIGHKKPNFEVIPNTPDNTRLGYFYKFKINVSTRNGIKQTSHFYYNPTFEKVNYLHTKAGYVANGTETHGINAFKVSNNFSGLIPTQELEIGDYLLFSHSRTHLQTSSRHNEYSNYHCYVGGFFTGAKSYSERTDQYMHALRRSYNQVTGMEKLVKVKELPHDWHRMSIEQVEYYFLGMIDSIGEWNEEDKIPRIISADRNWLKQLQEMFLIAGIHCVIENAKFKNNPFLNPDTTYQTLAFLPWTIRNAMKHDIGGSAEIKYFYQFKDEEVVKITKYKDFELFKDYTAIPITNITQKTETVYDLTVPSGEEFMAYGIANHNSRFLHKGKNPSRSILISSNTTSSSFTERRIAQGLNDPTVKIINARLWETKPKGTYSEKKFYVFVGSSHIDPFIVNQPKEINPVLAEQGVKSIQDETISLPRMYRDLPQHVKDLVIPIPTDFKSEFERNIVLALQNIGGISVAPQGRLFSSKFHYGVATTNTLKYPFTKNEFVISTADTIQVFDYFDSKWRPRHPDALRFIHVDQSLAHDKTGLSCCYCSKFVDFDGQERPYIEYDFVLRILPPNPPHRISISKVRYFILWFLNRFNLQLGKITYDSYASPESIQEFQRLGYNCETLSVDRDDTQYLHFINLLYEQRVALFDLPYFKNELFNLIHFREKRKVDHPKEGVGGISKDSTDSVVGSAWNCVQNINNPYVTALNPMTVFANPLSESFESKLTASFLPNGYITLDKANRERRN